MERKSKGFLAAGLGASCCVLPLVLLAVGLGGSLLTVFLVRYKAYLMTFAAAVLIYAWAQYARDAKQCSTQLCEIAGGRLRKWMLGANTAVVFFFIIITYTPLGAFFAIDAGGQEIQTAEASARTVSGMRTAAQTPGMDQLRKLSLRVEGMT